MIELIFSDSGAAGLAFAKSTGDTSKIASAEICSDKEGNETITPAEPSPYTGTKIDGDVSDIAAIRLMGDAGDISDLSDWSSRLKIIREISDVHEMEPDDWIEEEGSRAKALVQRLCDAAESGETVRIWWSDTPQETCGYYWAMSVLESSKGIIASVKVPRIQSASDGYRVINGTGELAPEDFAELLSSEENVETDKRHAAAMLWKTLASENSPLRAVMNGVPYSVPEDFYDWILRKALPDGEFKIADAIGRALAQDFGGVSDWWYARRIRHLIDCGELELTEHSERFYYSTVKKVVTK